MPSATVESSLSCLFLACSSAILPSQAAMFRCNSSTQNFMAGMTLVTPWNSGMANMFMNPICDFPSSIISRTGAAKRADGMPRSCSMSAWRENSSVKIMVHCAAT